MHSYPSHKSFSTWGRSQAFFPLQCKAILLRKFFPTWGRVKLSSAKMQSYPSWQILPILCREGFFPIMQSFYKSFPQIFISFFFLHFIFIHFFYFVLLFFSYFLKFLFNFLFCKTWNSSPKGKNYSPAFRANNRRINAPVSSPRAQPEVVYILISNESPYPIFIYLQIQNFSFRFFVVLEI